MNKKLIFTFLMTSMATLYITNVQAVSCGDYLTSSATLTADLNCVAGFSGAAVSIGADNITLNLNGHTISGPTEMIGISVNDSDHVNIIGNGGAVKGFWSGVRSTLSDDLYVSDTTFYDLGVGVIISSGNYALVENNDFIYIDSYGVYIANTIEGKGNQASNNNINNNEFYKNGFGIMVCGERSDNNIITKNLIWKSEYFGIELNHSNKNDVYYNNILDSSLHAISLSSSSHNTIYSNSLKGGNIGLSIIGGNTPRCFDSNPGIQTLSYKNTFTGNHVFDFITGIGVGLGLADTRLVFHNVFKDNKIYNDEIGISFNIDAHNNEAYGNAFTGTVTDVIDIGTDNSY